MRRVAHSVTVATTDGPAGRHGATVSSFCSVSADPPLVLVCLRAESRIAATVRANGAFCVNVLHETGAPLAERFAGRPDAAADRLDGIDAARGAGGAPVLADAVAAFSCRVAEVTCAGTHLVVVGEVLAVAAGEAAPLLYVDGDYAAARGRPHVLSAPGVADADHPR
ncbi:MAG: flavin reductase family protein [Proteobacteria bacterium]|nr:flavin reductase family protein [Pseudomonadota bacterium]